MPATCGKCGEQIAYVENYYGAAWVHVATGSFHSNVPEPHDCNTFIQRSK